MFHQDSRTVILSEKLMMFDVFDVAVYNMVKIPMRYEEILNFDAKVGVWCFKIQMQNTIIKYVRTEISRVEGSLSCVTNEMK